DNYTDLLSFPTRRSSDLGITMKVFILGLFYISIAFCFITNLSAQTTEFTYQGKLKVSGVDANGQYDMRFRLFDAEAGGIEVSGRSEEHTSELQSRENLVC